MRAQVVLVAAVAALMVAGTGCGDDGGPTPSARSTTDGATPAATPTPSTAETPAATSPGGIDAMPGASTAPRSNPARNRDVALMTGVRAARHEGYDRIVFEFQNAVPGYDVRYVDRPITQDGSGATVNVSGTAPLRIRMDNALDADLSKPDAPRTYAGPQRFAPGTPEIAELVRTGGFEGTLTWVAGLREAVDFRVLTLEDPPRLVVDVRNH